MNAWFRDTSRVQENTKVIWAESLSLLGKEKESEGPIIVTLCESC